MLRHSYPRNMPFITLESPLCMLALSVSRMKSTDSANPITWCLHLCPVMRSYAVLPSDLTRYLFITSAQNGTSHENSTPSISILFFILASV